MLHSLGPLLRLWNVMEGESDAESVQVEEEEGWKYISSLFERCTLLVEQSFNSTSYQRRLNILSTLIDSSGKVILKEQSFFEEMLSRETSARQKSLIAFTALTKVHPHHHTRPIEGGISHFEGAPRPRTEEVEAYVWPNCFTMR